jgi:hypothetical protein
LLQQRPETVENFLKAMIENIAFTFAPKNKPIVIKTIMRRLKADQNSAEEGYATCCAPLSESLSRPSKACAMPSV